MDEGMNGSGVGTAVLGATQAAAQAAQNAAQDAAGRIPDAIAGVQGAAAGTQRRLVEMPSEGLILGTSFSLGLGLGMLLGGSNRFFVAAALVPATAMSLTMLGRNRTEVSRNDAKGETRKS